MTWKISFSKNTEKHQNKLPIYVISALDSLTADLIKYGPAPGKHWNNYSKLKGYKKDIRHCHLIKGKPTFVCCWEVIDKQLKLIEVCYAGTHEKAPY